MRKTPLPGSPEKKQESRDAQKVLRLLEKKLKPLGFLRTKPTVFTRSSLYGLVFVHTHKYTFAPSFRIEFGFRVRSDDGPAIHLNGPSSSEIPNPIRPDRRKYDFDYTTDDDSWESCAQAMYQCAASEGLTWFAHISNPALLLSSASPLAPTARVALQKELEDPSTSVISEATRRGLNAA